MRSLLLSTLSRWRHLRAWPAPLGPLSLVVKRGRGEVSTGEAWACGVIIVRYQKDPMDALATLLHELAHISLYHYLNGRKAWRLHGRDRNHPWRKVYADAVLEVTGMTVLRDRQTYDELERTVLRALWQTVRRRA